MPRLSEDIAVDISHIALFSFLQPYMQDVNKFNAHRTEISAAVNAFLTQSRDGLAPPYGVQALFKAYQKNITVHDLSEEDEIKNQRALTAITGLDDEIRSQLSHDFANELMAEHQTAKSAVVALQEGNRFYCMADAIAKIKDSDPKAVRKQMSFYIDRYFVLKERLQPYDDRIQANKHSIDEQSQENADAIFWADRLAQQAPLLKHLSLTMKNDAAIDLAYHLLISAKTEGDPFTQEELARLEQRLCKPAGFLLGDNQPAKTMAEAIPRLLSHVAKDLSHRYIDIDAQGNPVKSKYERSVSALIQGIGTTLLAGLIVTNVLTVVPVIPEAASAGLNSLYSALFAASTSPVFSFKEIYLISLAFVFAINVAVFMASRYCENHGKEHVLALKERYIAPKLEVSVAEKADDQVKNMDNHLRESDRPTRKPIIAAYGQLTAKHEPVAKQKHTGISQQFTVSLMR